MRPSLLRRLLDLTSGDSFFGCAKQDRPDPGSHICSFKSRCFCHHSTSRFVRWHDEKYNTVRSGRDWVKCHIACGVKTHVVTAVEILDRDAADFPQFKPLLDKTAENFRIDKVSADKAYLSAENIDAVFDHGGTQFIAFKANSTGKAGGLFEWQGGHRDGADCVLPVVRGGG